MHGIGGGTFQGTKGRHMAEAIDRRSLAAIAFRWIGWLLLLAGAISGWVYPQVAETLGLGKPLMIADTGINAGNFLGAMLTALSVLIAVVIGFNVTLLQLAGQAHSLRVTQGVLAGMRSFIFSWLLVSSVTLAYFLVPVPYASQIWQEVLWFLAVTALMLEYLWEFPRRLSGEYLAKEALNVLKQKPIAEWEAQNSHSVLQSMTASAIQRGDLATARSLLTLIGEFLATHRDRDAERSPGYDRRRYRALRNLLIAAAQQLDGAPNTVSYALGFAEGGYLLQCVACGQHGDDRDHTLFSSLLRGVEDNPGQMVSLLTGVRHSLLRQIDDAPLIIRYWESRSDWAETDPRLTDEVAAALSLLFVEAERRLAARSDEVSHAKGPALIEDLYQSFDDDLLPLSRNTGMRESKLARLLLDRLVDRIDTLRAEKPDLVPYDAVNRSNRVLEGIRQEA